MHLPPRLLRRLVAACLPAEDERAVLDDLDALYDDRVRRRGSVRANWWYARQSTAFLLRVGLVRLAAFVGGADGLRDELRYAVRSLSRRPAFSSAFILTLAVGTGVVCTVYAAARWVLLRPVPHVAAANELFTMRLVMPEAPPHVAFDVGNPDVEVLRQKLPLRALAATKNIDVDISRAGSESRRVPGEMVSANYFTVLGTPLVAGRSFVAAEDGAAPPTAIIGQELAVALAGSAEAAVGSDLRINGAAVRVVGVAPAGFRGNELPGRSQIWLPLSTLRIVDPSVDPAELAQRGPQVWRKLIGRIQPGWTTNAIEREANASIEAIRKEFRSHSFQANTQLFRVSAGIGLDPAVRASVQRTLTFLGAASVLLLLLAAANLANLTLIRATLTGTTTAIRVALGASRLRIARAVFVDALVLAVSGTAGALVLAAVWSRWYQGAQLSEHGGPLAGMRLDPLVFGVTLSVALLVSFLAFAKPAMMSRFVALDVQLRRGTTGASTQRFRRALVATQVALSVMLLVGAGLLARTVSNLRAVDLGFDPDRILTLTMDPHLHGLEKRELGLFARDFDRQASSLAGVTAAGLISPAPLRSSYFTASLYPEGSNPSAKPAPRPMIGAGFYVSSGFFDAIGARVIAGQPRWTADSGEVVLTRSGVAQLFPNVSPRDVIGRTLPRSRGRTARVIAVLEDLRLSSITEAPPNIIFLPLADRLPGIPMTAFVSSSGRPSRLANPIRAVITSLAPELPTYDVRTARDAVDQQFAERVALARAATTLGSIGLLLAAFGLYGVLANAVAARRREMGIRAAMGATPARLLARVVRDGFVPVTAGLALGIGGALALTRALRGQLFAIESSDATTWALALATLIAAATVACLVPAWRASRTSPAEVLRDE